MRQQFDLVVIGTGTAAGVVAHKCRRAGWSVAVIDSRPFGGTCALRGCDPKKVLVGAAEAVDQVNRLRGKGVRADALRVEWSELMRFKRGMIEAVPGQREEGFARAGIETFHGRARFDGPNAITVGDHVLEGRRILVAAGAKPVDLGIEAASISSRASNSWNSTPFRPMCCSWVEGTSPSSSVTSPPALALR